MESQQILLRLTEIVEDQLDKPGLTLEGSTTADMVDGWDSIAHVRILVAAEEAFDIRFTIKEIAGLKTIGDLVNLISERTRA